MKGFRIAVGIFALIPLLTGLGDVVKGVAVWQGLGADLTEAGFHDPVLDSQVRFLATVWFGYGLLLCFCLTDFEKYAGVLRGALVFAFLGGVARVISILQVGMPETEMGSTFVIVALIIEFLVIPILLVWQYFLLRSRMQ